MKKSVIGQVLIAAGRFFKGLANTVSRLNLLGKVIFGVVSAAVVAGAVLAIVLPGRSADAADQKEELLAAAASTVVVTPSPTPSASPSPTPVPTPTPTPDPTLQQGDENEKVQQLQERLMELGYMSLDQSTQLYGPITKNSVILFQRQHELQQDGIAGQETLEAIYSDDAKKYMLTEGMKGTDVDSLQRQLIDLGYMKSATGYFGSETTKAVRDFQSRNSLGVDGLCGEQTFALLYSPNAVASASKAHAATSRANILEMIEAAKKQLGDPYILGNEGPDSFDCSGLVYYCLKQAGSSRGRYNAAGYSQVSDWEKVESIWDLEIGDLMFFYNNGFTKVGHVGIYVGSGYMIDASSSKGKVVKRECRTSYWKAHFKLARRPW